MKRSAKSNWIGNDSGIHKAVSALCSSMISKVWRFVVKQKGNGRSSTKTDIIHGALEELLFLSMGTHAKEFKSKYQVVVEKDEEQSGQTQLINEITDIHGQVFNVDILIKSDQKVEEVILVKCPMSSINKNRYNGVNSMFGELIRFYGNPKNTNVRLTFLNFVPKQTIGKLEDPLRSETVHYIGLGSNTDPNSALALAPIAEHIKQLVHEVTIYYDWEKVDLKKLKTCQEFLELVNDYGAIVIDEQSIRQWSAYVKRLLEKGHIQIGV